MDSTIAEGRDGAPVLIRDDIWALTAGSLLSVGAVLIVLAWIPAVGTVAAFLGAGCCIGAIWILHRRVGIILDPRTEAVIARGIVATRQLDFADVEGIGMVTSPAAVGAPGFPIELEQRYDVVLLAQGVEWATVKRDLDVASASREIKRLRTMLKTAN